MGKIPNPVNNGGRRRVERQADRFDLDNVMVRRNPRLRMLVGGDEVFAGTHDECRTMLDAAARELVQRTTRAQGLPERVEDLPTLAAIAAVLGEVDR